MNEPRQAHIDFLVARQTGIGGSDIGAILGVSSFKSAVDVFLAKTAPNPSEEQTELTYWGHAVEPIIARRYSEAHGVEIIRPTEIARHPRHDWMVGNLDGIIPGPPAGVLEIKNVNAFGTKHWGDDGSDEVPLAYVAQVAWYMAVLDMDHAVIAALFGGNSYREFRIERDQELEQTLIHKGHEFWVNHVLTGTAPNPRTSKDIMRLFRQDDGTTLNADQDLMEWCAQLKAARAQAKHIHEEVEQLETQIKGRMAYATQLTCQNQPLATWKTHSARRFNEQAFKAAHPDLHEQFIRVGKTRTFRLK